MRQSFDGKTKCSGKSEISNLKVASSINKKILRLKISMDNPSRVAVVDSVAELIEKELGLVRCHGEFMLAQVLFHVVFNQLKDQIELLFIGDINDLSQSMCK